MSGFDSFIAIDLETTGLDPSVCEILELGAVRYVNGELVEELSELVKPSIPIPTEITHLTGISSEMVKSSPAISLLFGKYQKMLEAAPWVVGHNVSFDLGFLKPHLSKPKFGLLEARVMDTGTLARILFPRLSRYSLASLVSHFQISRKRSHRALDDCQATAEVYLRLIAHLASLDIADRESIGRLLLGADSLDYFRQSIKAIKPIPASIVQVPSSGVPQEAEADIYPDNVTGEPPEKSYEDYLPVDTAAVGNCFVHGGLLSKRFPFYEYRTQQATMAIKVAETFNRSEFLLCEAPTGVGKSLAYLLPASWWASQNRERVVISTQTKSLQSQLFYKDLPLIQEAVDYKFQAVLLKGKGNYICLHKYHELLPEAEIAFEKRDRESLAALSIWVDNTKTGDISECNGFSPSQNYYLWSRISCEGSFCLGQGCRFADKCFLLKIRREAQAAQIVVTNHHLTFADFSSGGELALGAGNIIFDEAHNLEKIAASYLGNAVDKRNLDGILSDIYTSRPTQSGFLPNLRASLLYRSNDDDLIPMVESAIDGIIKVNFASNQFFSTVKIKGANDDAREIPYTSENNPCDIEEREALISSLEILLDSLQELTEEIRGRENLPKRRESIVRLESFATDILDFKRVASDVLYASNDEYVYWAEKPSSPRHAAKFLSAPLDVGKLLDKNFYDHLKAAVFTSATLTVEKKFDYIIRRLGLDSGSKERIMTVCLDSPFNINSQVAVISAGYLPSPKVTDFETAANQSLETILISGAKKSLVLFTSHRSLRNSAEYLKPHLEKAGIDLFFQESSYGSERVFRRFKAAKRAVLLGTDTFWEGVDLPGELLELLILFKLPFTVPDRPWFKANLERIEKNGESSFARLSLPEAVVKFRQGFGRLIRTATDRGCVVLLDSRVETSSFGRTFLNSVDGTKFRCKSPDEISKTIKVWLASGTN
jgi:ATP-dependent DNA helicase DinG